MFSKSTLAVAISLGIAATTTAMIAESADAQRRGGGARAGGARAGGAQRAGAGGGQRVSHANSQRAGRGSAASQHQVRSTASSSVNNRSRNVNRNTNVNRDRNVNRNVNRDLNVDVDVHHEYGYGHDWDDHYHPVARAAVATAAVATTAAIVGSYYRALPPNCATVYRGSVTYYQCGSAWYQPTYVGSDVQYIVVEAP